MLKIADRASVFQESIIVNIEICFVAAGPAAAMDHDDHFRAVTGTGWRADRCPSSAGDRFRRIIQHCFGCYMEGVPPPPVPGSSFEQGNQETNQ